MKRKITRRDISNEKNSLGENIHPILRRVYSARGVKDETDLEKELSKLLRYENLLGIQAAASCLGEAIKLKQRILIIGDFDADGATSTAVAVKALSSFGATEVSYLVPNRFEYGYGLTPEIVAVASKWQPHVIVTVDNGIASLAGAEAAKKLGIKLIITDHHLPGEKLPEAEAIVNPNQPFDPFPSKNLAGVGVIFYVMLALRTYLQNTNWFTESGIQAPKMAQFLDLVALGTYADVVPLDKNNRILVYQGLQRIRAGHCSLGILALLNVAKRIREKISAEDLGFVIGPRINAAGRLDDMSLGIECLLTEDPNKANEFAKRLDQLNQERRQIENQMKAEALKELQQLNLENKSLPIGLTLFDEKWHQGVSGILASRIKDKLHRPVIIFAPGNGDEIKGSARSIPGLHVRDVLQAIATKYPDLISKFGGHAMAAGLSFPRKNYERFAEVFDQEVRMQLNLENLNAEIYSDGELADHEFTVDLAQSLQTGGPWGQAFPEPVFDGIFNVVEQRIVGNSHLKLVLSTANGPKQLDAIAFNINMDEWPAYRSTSVHIAYRLDINEYRGNKKVQLVVEEIWKN